MSRNGAALPAIGTGLTRVFRAGVLCAAALALFVLPFAHPPSHPVVSVSYVAGADNRLATLGLALLSLLTLCVAWFTGFLPSEAIRQHSFGDDRKTGRISGPVLWGGIVAVVAFTWVLGFLVQRSGLRFGEASYFLERIRDVADGRLRIYRDIEFPYGPLLLLPPVWLHRALDRTGLSIGASYFVCLAGMNAAGVAMVAWLVNRMPLRRGWRTLIFSICVFVQMHPLAGANYSLFKFAAPPFLFVWAARRSGWPARAAAFVTANLVVLLISPELAVGTAGATFAYAALLLMRRTWSAALLLCTPPAAVAVFLMLFGRRFAERLAHASGGALNLIPEPTPHLIVLGFAVAWLVPVFVGGRLRHRSPDAPLLAGLFVLALGILPGAIGRCDPLHVFFNGLTFLVLSAVAVQGVRGRRVWASALLLLTLDVQAVNYRLYASSLSALLHPPAAPAVSMKALRAATGNAGPIATPVLSALPLPVELQMRRAGLFQTDFYPGLDEIWDEAGERQKIADLHRDEWMLAPIDIGTVPEPLPNTTVKRIFRFGYRYQQKNAPFVLGRLMNHDLETNWTRGETFGGLFLYHRKPDLQP